MAELGFEPKLLGSPKLRISSAQGRPDDPLFPIFYFLSAKTYIRYDLETKGKSTANGLSMTCTPLALLQTRIHGCQVQGGWLPSSSMLLRWDQDSGSSWGRRGRGRQGMQSGHPIPLRILRSPHTPGQLICCPWTSASPPVEWRSWSKISHLHTFPQGRGKGLWVPMPREPRGGK